MVFEFDVWWGERDRLRNGNFVLLQEGGTANHILYLYPIRNGNKHSPMVAVIPH